MNENGFAIAAMLEYKIHGRFLDTATRCLYDPFIKANEHRFKLMAMFCSLDRDSVTREEIEGLVGR